MKEPHGADALEDNLENPMALVALQRQHAALHDRLARSRRRRDRHVFGEQLACRMLADAGFVDVEVQPAPGDPGDAVYLARKAG